MIRRVLAIGILLCALFLAAPAHKAAAFDIIDGANYCKNVGKSSISSSDPAGSAACNSKNTDPNNNPLTGDDGLLVKITNIVAYAAGVAAVIIIIVSGLKFITANGDAGNIANARGTLINAVIGIIVIVLARALIIFVIKKVN